MKPNVERRRRVGTWLGVACLGLMPVLPLSAQEPKLRATLQGHTNAVVAVAFSPDGKTLASGGGDEQILRGEVMLRDLNTGNERVLIKGHSYPVWSVRFSLDGNTLASAGWDGVIRSWDVATQLERGME